MAELKDIVWLINNNTLGEVISRGAYASLVQFMHNGIEYKIYMENDEFLDLKLWEEENER